MAKKRDTFGDGKLQWTDLLSDKFWKIVAAVFLALQGSGEYRAWTDDMQTDPAQPYSAEVSRAVDAIEWFRGFIEEDDPMTQPVQQSRAVDMEPVQ